MFNLQINLGMKTTEIRELTVKEIIERIQTEKDSLGKMKMNHAITPMDNPLQIKAVRRDIARMQTVLRQKQNEENK